ncbi:uncharacterized protein CIMG_12994 [Coccidioides immitis RS]|uniref:Uncharacterized protein n=1 Tax=Coccidioides immitis (strain RS) TaxID=246410 RepID=J3K6W4_COCIM|nr:uncharacterized protein CIMG_12994 [Coccidioides immitis RS]EAS30360.3 hypothetical protein CIMG_12994 [Coccidioides immitis RS]
MRMFWKQVKSANQELGSYHLEELDGTEIKESIAGGRLKKYLIRSGMEQLSNSPADSDEEMENVSQKYATRSQSNILSSSSSDVSFLDREDDQDQSKSKNENNQEEMKQTQLLTVIPDDWSFAVVISSQDV